VYEIKLNSIETKSRQEIAKNKIVSRSDTHNWHNWHCSALNVKWQYTQTSTQTQTHTHRYRQYSTPGQLNVSLFVCNVATLPQKQTEEAAVIEFEFEYEFVLRICW